MAFASLSGGCRMACTPLAHFAEVILRVGVRSWSTCSKGYPSRLRDFSVARSLCGVFCPRD